MKLYWPLETIPKGSVPYISQKFGEHGLDYTQFGLKGHNGIDMPSPRNTPIHAAQDGWIIEQIAVDTGYGKRLCQRIDSDGKNYVVIYGHQDHFDNNVDIHWNFDNRSLPVKRGDVIGYVDSTGFSTGDHLHFGLYQYDSTGNKLNANNGYGGCIDPLPFLLAKEDLMNIYKIRDEQTLVVENASGEFYEIATKPELYSVVAEDLGLNDSILSSLSEKTRDEINSKLVGQLKTGLVWVRK